MMQDNTLLQQDFLNDILTLYVSNPGLDIDSNFIYSRIMYFNTTEDQLPNKSIKDMFHEFQKRYEFNKGIKTLYLPSRSSFLWFENGKTSNEIKLYIPLDYAHIKEGANQLFDFLASSGIHHQSKISSIIRNDDVVVRVNNLEDAERIVNYVNSNNYIKEGLMKTNPFLANFNGVGFAMDNNYSYNFTVCELISNFFNELKNKNRLDLFTINNLNEYIRSTSLNVTDPDLKDICLLIEKTTSHNFKFQDFINHASIKSTDKYTTNRKRIIDPSIYLEEVIIKNSKYYPQNSKAAILNYMKGISNYFTRKDNIRESLIRHVNPSDLVPVMRNKLQNNGLQIPNNDLELVDKYLSLVLNKELKVENENSAQLNQSLTNKFYILVDAYNSTLNVYGFEQAHAAILNLLINGEINLFTNRFKDRDKLRTILNSDIKKIVLSNIDINNLDVKNVSDIVNRFESYINEDTNYKQQSI